MPILNAQVSVQINIGSPPMWGPVGYQEARYYYIPDVEAYYDIHTSMFIYYSGGIWMHRSYLPGRYRNYDLYSGYKVVLTNYHGDRPYSNYSHHKHQYAKGYKGSYQQNRGHKPGNNNGNVHQNSSSNHDQHAGNNGNKNQKQSNGKGKSQH